MDGLACSRMTEKKFEMKWTWHVVLLLKSRRKHCAHTIPVASCIYVCSGDDDWLIFLHLSVTEKTYFFFSCIRRCRFNKHTLASK